jgi:hypothetical protein
VELPVEKVKMSVRRRMGLADTKKRTQTVAMAAPRTIRAETVANRPRPDPPPPIRGLWRGTLIEIWCSVLQSADRGALTNDEKRLEP